MPQSPKKNITKLNLKRSSFGNQKRIENTLDAFDKNLVFPKPVEYEDIDRAVLEFVRDEIKLTAENKEAPTFTLFSNQRFSEYSQTWEHTDEEGNLLMDFKTVNRESNPMWGENQGGLFNIPGDRRYTTQIKEVLDDNGTESYEVYSMGQPLSVDLEYTINYVTADWSKLNDFNIQLNELFKSIQYYIKPNGWYMPMKLESIDDETEYAVDNRKIYIQSASITVQGIISTKSTHRVEKFPKRNFVGSEFDTSKRKANVNVEENIDGETDIEIYFPAGIVKTEFTFDDVIKVKKINIENVRDFSIMVNEERVHYAQNGFWLNEGMDVKIKINPIENGLPAKIIFKA